MLAQAYHWSLDEIKQLSYVQVLMLQHAASCNRKVLDARIEEGRKNNSLSPTEGMADDARHITELSSDEIMQLAGGGGGKAPKVIQIRKDPNAKSADLSE